MGKRRLDRKIVYVDMDGVLCDFATPYLKNKSEDFPYPHSVNGFFLDLLPLEKSIESFKKLEEIYDVWILTRPSAHNVHCYTEKALWIKNYLGFEVQKRTIMCGDKSLLKGDYLIDDTLIYGQSEFEGELIHFGSDRFPDWDSVIKHLIK